MRRVLGANARTRGRERSEIASDRPAPYRQCERGPARQPRTCVRRVNVPSCHVVLKERACFFFTFFPIFSPSSFILRTWLSSRLSTWYGDAHAASHTFTLFRYCKQSRGNACDIRARQFRGT